MCPSQVLAKISINCREKRIDFARAFSGALRRLRDRRSSSAGGKSPKDSQQPNIVSVAKQRADLDQLSIADLTERGRNFFFLRWSEEAGAFGEFAALNSGGEMTVNSAAHKTSGTRDFIDRFASLKSPQRFRLTVIQMSSALPEQRIGVVGKYSTRIRREIFFNLAEKRLGEIL